MNKAALEIVATMLIVCCLLALSTTAVAQSSLGGSAIAPKSSGQCSNKTIKGNYGCYLQGLLIFGPTQLPFVGLTMEQNDGNGNKTSLEHVVVNGTSFNDGWDANTFTYNVNPNCTGKAVGYSPNSSDPIIQYFVVVDNGKEIDYVNAAHALPAICKRVGGED